MRGRKARGEGVLRPPQCEPGGAPSLPAPPSQPTQSGLRCFLSSASWVRTVPTQCRPCRTARAHCADSCPSGISLGPLINFQEFIPDLPRAGSSSPGPSQGYND